MTQREMLRRYCVLGSLVAGLRFDHAFAADCFCPEIAVYTGDRWRTDEEIVQYIENAVVKAIAKDTHYSKQDVRLEHARRMEN